MSEHDMGAKCTIASIGLVSTCLTAFLIAGVATGKAQAPPAPGFAGKTVNMTIGFGPGGGYDTWGRLVAAHIGTHLPGNPTVVAQNLPGGGSYRAASYMYHQAPNDGTALALIARDAVLGPLTGETGALFDATKFSWIGTPATETNICIAYHTAPVKTVHDLTEKELIVGDNGPGTGTDSYPKALNAILGFKFKLVGGYPSSADVFLAMERGEVQGICESLDSVMARRPDWISSGTVAVLFQGGAKPNPKLPGVPFVLDLAQKPEDKQAIEFLYVGQGIGRPFIAPPGVPAPTLKILRDAFDATMKDPAFIDEVAKRKYALDPEDGATLEALIKKAYATPKPIIERIAKLIQ
jgi:tripartite-type tricarboxylate transporter receptor subunit TctC